MTAPVTVDVAPGQGPTCGSNFTVSFFVSNDMDAAPPAPSSPDVFLRAAGAADVYVRAFGGWAQQARVVKQAAALQSELRAAGVAVPVQGGFTTAGYDSPFRVADRHNEIWVAAPPPPDATAR